MVFTTDHNGQESGRNYGGICITRRNDFATEKHVQVKAYDDSSDDAEDDADDDDDDGNK